MPHPTAVILVVGLTREVIGARTPRLRAFMRDGEVRTLAPVLPAVTCSVQASMLTGLPISGHGIVGNGWYNRELDEVHFWKQSNRLVAGEKVWETARKRDASVTTANVCWWFNMCSTAEFSVTPRPIYAADGRKFPDCATAPTDLRDLLQAQLGPFPLFHFWGPGASIKSSQWIAEAAQIVQRKFRPTLNLVYIPHLDYALQKHAPESAEAMHAATEVDSVVGGLIDHYETQGVRVMIVSEYGIEPIEAGGGGVPINRVLRESGFLRLRIERGREMLDTGGSAAFAVVDHQVAHVYVKDPGQIAAVSALLSSTPGVERCLDARERAALDIDHARSGDLLAVAAPGRWFSYGWWTDDSRAPDFARTVDIHRKPGYDPLELFTDPRLVLPRLTIARKLLLRRLGFRWLFDVVPLDTSLVRGTHGRVNTGKSNQPVLMSRPGGGREGAGAGHLLPCGAVRDVILGHLFD